MRSAFRKNADALTLHGDHGFGVVHPQVRVNLAQVFALVDGHHVDQGQGEAAVGGVTRTLAHGLRLLAIALAGFVSKDPGEPSDVLGDYFGLTGQRHVGAAARGQPPDHLQLHSAPHWTPAGGRGLTPTPGPWLKTQCGRDWKKK